MQKKRKRNDQHGHKLEKYEIILYANNSNGQNTWIRKTMKRIYRKWKICLDCKLTL